MTAAGRRIVFTGAAMTLVIIVAFAAVWIGLNKKYKAPSPFRCLPSWTAAVVRLNDRAAVERCLHSTRYGVELTDMVGGAAVLALSERIDSLFGEDVVSMPILAKRDLYVSFSFDNDGTLTQLTASFCLNNRLEWHKAMGALKAHRDVSVRDTSINGHGLFVLSQKGFPDNLYMAAGGGCLFASLSPHVPVSFGSDSVIPMHDDAAFSTIERTVTVSAPVSVYINNDCFSSAPNRKQALRCLFGGRLLQMSQSAQWLAVDLGLHDDGMTADGFAMASNPSLHIMMAAESSEAVGMARRLPLDLRRFVRVAAGSRGLSSKAFAAYLNSDTASSVYRSTQSELYRRTNVDVEALLSQVFAAEMALCSYADTVGEKDFLVVDTRGGTMAQSQLTQALTAMHGGASPLIIGEMMPGTGAVPHGVTANRADAQQVGSISVPVYGAFTSSDSQFFLPYLFGRKLPCRLFFRYEDAIVFADDMKVLRRVLVDYVVGNTMVGRPEYNDLMAHFGSECSRFSVEKTDPMTGFGVVCSQLTTAGRLPYVSLFAQTADDQNRTTEQMARWKIRLDSLSNGRLFATNNHYTQLSECVIQDAANRIHLIGADGMLLWKRAVDGPIVGDVTQIDYYNNGKLQFLFSTPSSLYLVDRLGNDVGSFPTHLNSKAVSGANAATYSDGSPLRFFVGCDGGVLLYGPDGERVDGWSMRTPEGELHGRGNHFVCNGKDYLVFADRFTYYFNDRRGNKRLTADPVAPGVRSRMCTNAISTAFISTSADGQIVSIDEGTGRVSRLDIDSIGAESIGVPIDVRNYFVCGPHRAALIDISGSLPKMRRSWNMNLKSIDQVEVIGDIIALLDGTSQQVHLFSIDGRELMCSPMAAKGSIALGNSIDGKVLFTIGNGNEVLQLPVIR